MTVSNGKQIFRWLGTFVSPITITSATKRYLIYKEQTYSRIFHLSLFPSTSFISFSFVSLSLLYLHLFFLFFLFSSPSVLSSFTVPFYLSFCSSTLSLRFLSTFPLDCSTRGFSCLANTGSVFECELDHLASAVPTFQDEIKQFVLNTSYESFARTTMPV